MVDRNAGRRLGSRIGLLTLAVAALLVGTAAAAPERKAPKPKLGARCTKVGLKAKAGGTQLSCKRHGKRLLWTPVGSGKTGSSGQGAGSGTSSGGTGTGGQGSGGNSGTAPYQPGTSCRQGSVSFTSPPLALDQIGFIWPLGRTNGPHVTPVDHMYLTPVDPQAPDNTYPVLMPADGTVVGIEQLQGVGEQPGRAPPVDHRLVISHSCRYYTIFIHIHDLAPTLQAAAAGMKNGDARQVSIPFKAGDVIGYIGGSPFDWTVVDNTTTLGFVTPSLYASEPWKIHSISPFDAYSGTLKSQLEAKSVRTAAPPGGKISYDRKGTLLGNWFREGSGGYGGSSNESGNGYWDGHLAIVPDSIDGRTTIVSTGNWQGQATQFVVKGSPDPASITTASGLVTFELTALDYVTGSGAAWDTNSFASGVHPMITCPFQRDRNEPKNASRWASSSLPGSSSSKTGDSPRTS